MSDNSCWIANVSDGSTHTEKWIAGELSPWRRLMLYCESNNVYVTNLRMTVGTQTVSCMQNAIAYWQSNAMPAVQGVECDEELHMWHGIGWVENDQVNVIWGARDPLTHDVIFWSDSRPAKGQEQIIWGPKQVVNPEDRVILVSNPVKKAKEYVKSLDSV